MHWLHWSCVELFWLYYYDLIMFTISRLTCSHERAVHQELCFIYGLWSSILPMQKVSGQIWWKNYFNCIKFLIMSEIYWDVPNVPEGLKKWFKSTDIEDVLAENPTKKSWKHKVVRHKIKQIVNSLVDNINK